MAEAEARVLGAGTTITVNGKEVELSPVNLGRLAELQQMAVDYWKREYLRSYATNLDLLPDRERATELLERKLDEVARMGVDDLPTKKVYDVRLCDVSGDKIAAQLTELYEEVPKDERTRKALLSTALDAGDLTAGAVERLCGVRPRIVSSPYDSWWVTATRAGQVAFVWSSVRVKQPGITKDDVQAWPIPKLVEAANVVERLTAPAVGNT